MFERENVNYLRWKFWVENIDSKILSEVKINKIRSSKLCALAKTLAQILKTKKVLRFTALTSSFKAYLKIAFALVSSKLPFYLNIGIGFVSLHDKVYIQKSETRKYRF